MPAKKTHKNHPKNTHPHDEKLKDLEPDYKASLQKHLEKDELLFDLPSEGGQRKFDGILVENSYFDGDKQQPKHNLNQKNSQATYQNIQPREHTVGRKSPERWSKNVEELRKKFSFSWQKMSRKLVVAALIVSIFVIIGVTTLSAIAIDFWNKTPSIDDIIKEPSQSSVVYARDGKTKIYEYYDEAKRESLTNLNDVPRAMQLAVVALEDENYFDPTNETGIPWKNLAGAAANCVRTGGDECRGGSGISQQLIKNITGNDEATADRKIKELFTAIKLNQNESKTTILLNYLNWAPFGRNAYGVQEAAKSYFGRPVTAKDAAGEFILSAPEACYLASMIQLPSYYSSQIDKLPQANELKQKSKSEIDAEKIQNEGVDTQGIPQAAVDLEARKDACLTKLRNLKLPIDDNGTLANFISGDQDLENLKNTPVVSVKSDEEAQNSRKENKIAFVTLAVDDPFPHFREYITKELNKFVSENQLRTEGYTITTTIDPQMQAKMEEVLKSKESTIKQSGGNNAASTVLDGPTGEIMAMVGSLGYNRDDIDGKVNIATSPQQPGSSIKPYVYAAAFKNGFNPGTTLMDVQTTWDGTYTPKNYDGRFRGPVTIARALQGSLNIPAVKALFLNNDKPVTNKDSKLDTFFDFTDQLGVTFPCVTGATNLLPKFKGAESCSPDADKGISQEDADKAYRGRCYIATAIGGCELTMLSHATGFNSFGQEKSIDATPFISIVKKSTGEDVYKQRQNSKNPVYRTREMDDETKLIARQMTYVMTQYDLRIPEFGSTRFNFQLNNTKQDLACKSGTSNGPKDFWTNCTTPYYTTSVWVGRTDNKDMDPFYSSGTVAGVISKEMNEYLIKGKEIKNFSKEGLINTETPSGSWLLTPKQKQLLYGKGGKITITTPEELEKLKKNGIFQTRSTLIPTVYSINSLDNKLFVEGKNLPQNKKEVTCNTIIPEFQDANWKDPVDAWLSKASGFCSLPAISDQDQVASENAEPSISTNINPGVENEISNIIFSAQYPAGFSKSITKVRLLINGVEQPVSSSGNNLDFPTTSLLGQTVNITLEATDNLGKAYIKVFNNVIFAKPTLSIYDIVSINCPTSIVFPNQMNCTIPISASLKTSGVGVEMKVDSADAKICTISGGSISCSNVSTPSVGSPKVLPIQIRITGSNNSSWVTKGQVEVK